MSLVFLPIFSTRKYIAQLNILKQSQIYHRINRYNIGILLLISIQSYNFFQFLFHVIALGKFIEVLTENTHELK